MAAKVLQQWSSMLLQWPLAGKVAEVQMNQTQHVCRPGTLVTNVFVFMGRGDSGHHSIWVNLET